MNSTIAQETLSARPLSDAVHQELSDAEFSDIATIPLSSTDSREFAYNIEIDFKSKNIPTQSLTNDDFIIAATQEDFFAHKDFFLALLEFAQNGSFKFNLNFIFTAGDKRNISGNEQTMGTEFFCKSIEGAQNKHALVLDFDTRKKAFVTPGGTGEVSPLYLTKTLCTALGENSVDYALTGGIYLSLYNLGILKSEERLNAFLSREFPAIMLGFIENQSDYTAELNSIKDFLSQIELSEVDNWSRHYIPMRFGAKTFWLEEEQILVLIMIFTSLCLLVASDFSFLFRKRSRRLAEIKTRALKSNNLIILIAAVLALSFIAGQAIARALMGTGVVQNIFVLFVIKISFPFLMISVLFPIELKVHKNLPPYIYEYVLTISALLNVFIFTMLDISLFFLFALEYLILAFSRISKRTVFLYICMVLFLLPFIPLIYSVLIYANTETLFGFVFSTLKNNVILSFAFVPLCLLWFRILLRLKLKAYETKKMVVLYITFSAICLAGIAAISAITIPLLNKFFFSNIEFSRPFARIENADKNEFTSVSIYDTEYYGGKLRHIEVAATKEVERYSIYVEGQSANPIYFSIYETAALDGRTEFILPENPPQNIDIYYVPDSSENSIITVEAYYMETQEQGQRAYCKRENFVFDVSGERIIERAK